MHLYSNFPNSDDAPIFIITIHTYVHVCMTACMDAYIYIHIYASIHKHIMHVYIHKQSCICDVWKVGLQVVVLWQVSMEDKHKQEATLGGELTSSTMKAHVLRGCSILYLDVRVWHESIQLVQ